MSSSLPVGNITPTISAETLQTKSPPSVKISEIQLQDKRSSHEAIFHRSSPSPSIRSKGRIKIINSGSQLQTSANVSETQLQVKPSTHDASSHRFIPSPSFRSDRFKKFKSRSQLKTNTTISETELQVKPSGHGLSSSYYTPYQSVRSKIKSYLGSVTGSSKSFHTAAEKSASLDTITEYLTTESESQRSLKFCENEDTEPVKHKSRRKKWMRQRFAKTYTFKKEEQWFGEWDNVFVLLAGSVGFGDLFFFPQNAKRFGLFRYLFVYTVVLIFYGFPMMLLEAGLGQFCSRGPGGCWQFARFFSGIGYAMIFYNAAKFLDLLELEAVRVHGFSKTISSLFQNHLHSDETNATLQEHEIHESEEHDHDIHESEEHDIHESEESFFVGWGVFNSLLFSWFLALCIFLPRIPTRGRIVTCMCAFSICTITIITVAFASFPGAEKGLEFILMSDKTYNIFERDLWTTAIHECFSSFSLLAGVYLTLSSYNNFHNILIPDVVYSILIDYTFCLLGVVFTFSIEGYHSSLENITASVHLSDEGHDEDHDHDVEYTYRQPHIYEEIVELFPKNDHIFLLILFQLAAIVITINNSVALGEVTITGVLDVLEIDSRKRMKVVLIVCSILFVISLVYTTRFRNDVQTAFDLYISSEAFIFIGTWTLVAILKFIGVKKFLSLLECSIGWETTPLLSNHRAQIWWRIIWSYVCPVCCVGVMVLEIYLLIHLEPPEHLEPRVIGYTVWAITSLLFLGPMVYLMLTTKVDEDKATEKPTGVKTTIKFEGVKSATIVDRVKARFSYLTSPTPKWGPSLPSKKYLMYIGEKDEKRIEQNKKKKKVVETFEELSMMSV